MRVSSFTTAKVAANYCVPCGVIVVFSVPTVTLFALPFNRVIRASGGLRIEGKEDVDDHLAGLATSQ